MTHIQILAGIAMGVWCLAVILVVARKRSIAMDTLLMTVWLWVLIPLFLVADDKFTAANVIGAIVTSPLLAGAFAFRWWLLTWYPFGRRP